MNYAISDQTFFRGVVAALKDSIKCLCSVAIAANTLRYATEEGEESPLLKLTAELAGSCDIWMLPQKRRVCLACRESIPAGDQDTDCLQQLCAKMTGRLAPRREVEKKTI